MNCDSDTDTDVISMPYKIEQCPKLGRYLVATRDIKRGEVILTDVPLVSGPIKNSDILCTGCFGSPEINCENCGWPICSEDCTGMKNHLQEECAILKSAKKLAKAEDWTKLSDFLMILRCLLLKRQKDQRSWTRLLEMEANWDQWSRSPHYSSAKLTEQSLRSEFPCLTQAEFPTTEILQILAILDINSFEIRLPDTNIQGIYNVASLAEHDCLPNTHKTICSNNLELIFRASTDIPCGAHISTTYCDTLWPTWHRQQFLQWSKFFFCACQRCESSTELDSHLGSLLCFNCVSNNHHRQTPNGKSSLIKIPAALPVSKASTIPSTSSSGGSWEKDYRCVCCHTTFPSSECQLLLKKADDELSELDKYASFEIVSTFEQWLGKWTDFGLVLSSKESHSDDDCEIGTFVGSDDRNIWKNSVSKPKANLLLHPQHSLVLDACHTLFLLYPKENPSLLKRKEMLGEYLLAVTRRLFTGISKFRGTISYELALTKAAILVHQLEQSGLTDNLQQLAQEVLNLLEESQELLKYEPVDQPEGKLAQTGASQLEQLRQFFCELFS